MSTFKEHYLITLEDSTEFTVSVDVEHGVNEKSNHDAALATALKQRPNCKIKTVEYV